ncbi:Acyl-CoA synthetase member 3 [Mactra antiquata]
MSLPSFRRSMLSILACRTKSRLTCRLSTCNQLQKNSSLITKKCKFLNVQSNNTLCRLYIKRNSSATSHVVPVFLQAEKFGDRTAVVTSHGHYSYEDLLHYSSALAHEFNSIATGQITTYDFNRDSRFPLAGERIAFLCDNDLSYIVTQWAVWMCGAVAVPLFKSHPETLLSYFVEDSQAKLLVSTEENAGKLQAIAESVGVPLKVLQMDDYSGDYDEKISRWSDKDSGRHLRNSLDAKLRHDEYKQTKALIVYTSGTTGKPKGVVHTFGSINAQIKGMITSWGWTKHDVILHVLPLHHVHGIVNVLLTPLYCGATCVMEPKFDAKSVWKALTNKDSSINLFMAVPTIYAKLIEEYELQKQSQQPYLPEDLLDVLNNKIRLMVSGSAALPESIMRKWKDITGHTLLERYGMTEIGMALTNPLHGERLPGHVGMPLPCVTVAIENNDKSNNNEKFIVTADSDNVEVTNGLENESGELLIKGDNLFTEYWNKTEATKETFTEDGWFKTGDTAMLSSGVFKIVGRTSVDVIKSGGYKISALDIERHLLEHPLIKDVAVIGLPDEMWGEIVASVVTLKTRGNLPLEDLQTWCKDKMPSYHIPKVLNVIEEIPRNAMGKVNKKELTKSLFSEYFP